MGIIGSWSWSWALDGWIVVAGILSAVAATLLGNFLVLRRMSMLGDAISHAVLPGLAAAYFISGTRSSFPMFLGAVIVGIITAFFTEWIRGVGKVDEGASMGVVFTSLFALGLVMIVQAADDVDLDPGCVLYGAIEFTPLDTIEVLGVELPRAVAVLSVVALINTGFVVLFYKELKLSSFDPALSTTAGFNSQLLHYLLMILVAVTAVASFETVGNILVVAMFVVPPATALMLTDRLPRMIGLSVILAAISAILGHLAAITIPAWFGFQSTTTAGMMAVMTGILLGLAIAFAPRHGVVIKYFRHRLLSLRILADDVVALLYRMGEGESEGRVTFLVLKELLLSDRFLLSLVLWWLQRSHLVEQVEQHYRLTESGNHRGRELVRSHRLWEQYLVSEAGLGPHQIHDKAERFEHFTNPEMRERLDASTSSPDIDPHGAPIPPERQQP